MSESCYTCGESTFSYCEICGEPTCEVCAKTMIGNGLIDYFVCQDCSEQK